MTNMEITPENIDSFRKLLSSLKWKYTTRNLLKISSQVKNKVWYVVEKVEPEYDSHYYIVSKFTIKNKFPEEEEYCLFWEDIWKKECWEIARANII